MHQNLPKTSLGKLYGVGVGPGDPELITVKGINRIKQASVIAYPKGLHGKPGIAEQIADQWIAPHQKRLALSFPYVHDPDVLSQAWTDAAKSVWHSLSQGDDVVFLCEGDISFYSTFSHLADTLQQRDPRVSVEAIPGVCSPMAAAAALGKPLTTQGQRLVVLPALYHVSDLETALDTAEVVVLMKLKSVYEQVWAILQRRQVLHQSYVVEWATWPQQRVYNDLGDRPSLDLSYFSVLVIQQGTLMPSSVTRIN
jgi:precorrin-2/cobalt-factor-2 C20-methyltransferase